jgi:hypothetical protein
VVVRTDFVVVGAAFVVAGVAFVVVGAAFVVVGAAFVVAGVSIAAVSVAPPEQAKTNMAMTRNQAAPHFMAGVCHGATERFSVTAHVERFYVPQIAEIHLSTRQVFGSPEDGSSRL